MCLLTAGPIQAQEKDKEKDREKDKMHRLEIYNGGHRTVHYSGDDAAAAGERTRKENDAAVADVVRDLRGLYLRNELAMERKRHQMQMLLYGYTTTYGASLYAPSSFDWGYGGWGWGWNAWGGYPAGVGTVTHGLQNGIGDEGVTKSELLRGLLAPPERKP
jgi:hypothetical protein